MAPPKSKRQSIIDAVITRLKTIAAGATYSTSMGSHVRDWKVTTWDQSEIPGVMVHDVSEDVEAGTTREHVKTMHLEIDAVVKNGTTTGAEMREALADLETCVKADETWGGLASRTVYRSNKFALMQEDATVAMVQMVLDIEYRILRYDPYTEAGQ